MRAALGRPKDVITRDFVMAKLAALKAAAARSRDVEVSTDEMVVFLLQQVSRLMTEWAGVRYAILHPGRVVGNHRIREAALLNLAEVALQGVADIQGDAADVYLRSWRVSCGLRNAHVMRRLARGRARA